MDYAWAIYEHSRRLPEAAAREALDFVQFLEQRHGSRVEEDDASEQARRDAAVERLANLPGRWEGKPIPDRDAFYDEVRAKSQP